MPGYKSAILKNKKNFSERLLCCICQLLLRAAMQSTCGHRYCESCVEERLISDDGSQVRCPVCPGDAENGVWNKDQIHPDFHARKELRTLKVKCQNERCTWRGTFEKYAEHETPHAHETLCDFAPIKCFKAGCGKSLRRGDLPHHLEKDCHMRNVKCRNCRENYPYKQMKRHNAVCPKATVTCDDCKSKVTRETLSHHQDYESGDCPNRKTTCPYITFGCNEQIGIDGMDHHLQTHAVNHVTLQSYRYGQLCQRMEELVAANGRGNSLGIGEEETASVSQMAKKVDGTESKYDSLKRKRKYPYGGGPESRKSRLFDQMPNEEKSASADANLNTSGTDILVDTLNDSFENLCITNKEDAVTCGKCPALEIKLTEMKSVIDQQREELNQMKTLYAVLDKKIETLQDVIEVLNNERIASDDKVVALEKENRKLNDTFNHQERVHGRMFTAINASLAAQEVRLQSFDRSREAQNQPQATGSREPTRDGKLTWKIHKDKIKCEKQAAATATAGGDVAYFNSPVFHDRVGYNLCCRIYLNGNEYCDGKHVPLYLVVLKEDPGQIEMPWPFRRKVAILISTYNKKKRQSWREVPSSVQHMRFPCESDVLYRLPLAHFQAPQYVKEGFLCLRIDVEDAD